MSHQQFDFKPSELLQDGWCQGALKLTHNGRVIARCARQAITDACLGKDQEWLLLVNLYQIIKRRPITFWNDDESQTEENVIATMAEAERRAGIC